jgi:hypothetical protein
MCLGSLFKKPESPQMPAPLPAPAPAPVPTPSEISPQLAGDARRKQLERLRRGLSSTIKTKGITGAGAELSGANQTGKATLG